MKNNIPITMIFVLYLFAMPVFTQQNIVDKIQKQYENINDAVIHYSQTVRFPLTHREQEFEGVVYFKRPSMYRIESEQYTIVTDGKSIWSYNPFADQVIVDNFKEDEQTFTPDRFLLNIPKDYYIVKDEIRQTEDQGLVLLYLTPKDEHQYMKSLRIWIDESTWLFKKVEVIDLNDNRTIYTVREIEINKGINRDIFSFTPTSGVEIIDMRNN